MREMFFILDIVSLRSSLSYTLLYSGSLCFVADPLLCRQYHLTKPSPLNGREYLRMGFQPLSTRTCLCI